MKEKLALHTDRLQILSRDQHWFHWDHSTGSNLIKHHQLIIEALEKGKAVNTIYIDLSRAFNRVSHTRLLRKLKEAGFWRDILDFFEAFLRGRHQRVYGNGCLSSSLPMTSGTPEGMALLPLYFTIFITSISQCYLQTIQRPLLH